MLLGKGSGRGLSRLVALTCVLASAPSALATDFAVNSGLDDGSPGTMRWAIEQLNAAGPGNHSITFDDSINSLAVSSSLPHIDATGMTVVINGFGCTLDGNDQHRLVFVAAGNVTLLNFNLENGAAQGGAGGSGAGGGGGGAGMGGALFVNGGASVTLSNVNFDSNSASGGAGGSYNSALGGGAGGGAGGNGGTATNFGGAGGGGLFGNGGNSSGNGGGGAGGLLGHGGASVSSGGGGAGGILLPGTDSLGSLGGIGALTGGDGGSGTFINGGNGGDGIIGGGGGGGGEGTFGTAGHGGDGGAFAGGGGGGYGDTAGAGGDGGSFGGGGGAGVAFTNNATSGNGGFAGGGGGAPFNGAAGTGGFGGGDGGVSFGGGNGGSGYGGAVFVRDGGSLTIINSAITNSTANAGAGGSAFLGANGTNGSAAGTGIYLHTGVTATVQISTGPTYTYQDTIAGAGGLTKTGTGTLTLGGNNTYTGATTVSAGQLQLTGQLTSDVTVAANSTFSGTGTILNRSLTNNGTVAPGASIGQLETFTYTNGSAGALEIEINDGGTTSGTNVDLLKVTDVATLNGGTVNVKAAAGTYSAGSKYTFLEAGNYVTGTFTTITDDLAFLDAVLGYEADNVYFTLVSNSTDYAALACTKNTFDVGTYLDNNSAGATGSFADLLDDLNQVSNAEACYALEQLTGAVYGSTGQIGVQNTTIYIQTLAQRLRSNVSDGDGTLAAASRGGETVFVSSTEDAPVVIRGQCCQSRWSTWATGLGLGGNATSDGNAAGLDYTMGGTLTGMETGDNCDLLGFYGGYLYNNIATNANESNTLNGGTFGSYYVGRQDNHHTLLAGGFEFDGYESRRRIAFANLTAEGETDGWKGYSYLEHGITLGSQRFAIQPFGGLQYIYVRQNGFTETGAAAANLVVPGIDTNSFRSVLGSRVFGQGYRRGSSFTPEVRALWLHEFLETETSFSTFFSGVGGGTFAINGLGMGRDWAVLGTGVKSQLTYNWSTYADYDLMINDQTAFHIGSGGVQYMW